MIYNSVIKTLHIPGKIILICLLVWLTVLSATAAELQYPDNPIEAGNVKWTRDLESALAQSKISGKPLFLLFQEIPGCIGCQTFGSEVLTDPLLVKAIENEFLPVLIYNNRSGGKDESVLNRFNEPSWNFQVIRFVDAEGKDLIPRKDKVWTIAGVAARMVEALTVAGRSIPPYLQTMAMEKAGK